MGQQPGRMAALLMSALLLSACGAATGTDPGTTTQPELGQSASTPQIPQSKGASPLESGGGEDLPGEPIDLYPYEGAELGAMGVESGTLLAVRSGPGTEFEVLEEHGPLTVGMIATGHNRKLEDGSVWAELSIGQIVGWADTAFLAQPGQESDITGELDELPTAPTVREAAQQVAQQRASEEPPSDITVVDEPAGGDMAEITVDVVSMGDDALAGERLHIFAEQVSGEFTVVRVESKLLCSRGVSDGLCV